MFLSKPLPNPSAGSWRSPQFVNIRPAQSFSRGLNIFMSFRGFRQNMFLVRWLSIFISPKTSSTSCSVTSNLHFWAKKSNERINLKMAIDINDTNNNHRPVSKTAQHGFDESPTIPAPLSPSLYCGAQVCGQEYLIRSLFCSTIHFSSPTQPLPNFRLFSF